MSHAFIGRQKELVLLESYAKRDKATLVVIHGRRRIGKSRLTDEFAKNKTYYHFTGLAPGPGVDAQVQRDEFARKLAVYFGLPSLKITDWADLFTLLAKQCNKGKIVILFDEISWMAIDDPTFLSKFKNAWDREFKQNNKLMLILCGSVSSWIEKNILSSTGFVGRVHQVLTLNELPLQDSMKFLSEGKAISFYEKVKFLAVTGGVPLYLESYNKKLSSEENIKQLCFQDGGLLVREFNNIFSDLFGKQSAIYTEIVNALANGPIGIKEISQKLNKGQTGWLSELLATLEKSFFITREYTWNLKNGDNMKSSHYRLTDNYIRFYLKYIRKNLDKIKRGQFDGRSLSSLPGWSSVLGYQVENLVLKNRLRILNLLNIHHDEVVNDNPYFQRSTTKQHGCQIDYMIQTKFNNLYIGEIKSSQSLINAAVIKEVKTKIEKINMPKGFSYRPFLIHVNGVTDDLIEQDFFSHIISLEDLATT